MPDVKIRVIREHVEMYVADGWTPCGVTAYPSGRVVVDLFREFETEAELSQEVPGDDE